MRKKIALNSLETKPLLTPKTANICELKLYVAGQTPRCLMALATLKKLCEAHLQGLYHLEVIDLVENPQRACDDQILAIPTLVRKQPLPIRKIIGDLSNTESVLTFLQLPLLKPQL